MHLESFMLCGALESNFSRLKRQNTSRKFVKEILVLMVLWFVVGFSYYGFIYSFSELSDHVVQRSIYSGEYTRYLESICVVTKNNS